MSVLFAIVNAGLFIALGLSGVIPAGHFVITDGFYHAFDHAALGWVLLMAALYITGAVIYAARIPERIWPGRFDIWVSINILCIYVTI
jgi:adiponectin receptor